MFLGPNCSYTELIYFFACGFIGLVCGLLGCLFNRIVLKPPGRQRINGPFPAGKRGRRSEGKRKPEAERFEPYKSG